MVRTSEIHHLEVKVLLSKVSRIPKRDRELDASKMSGFGFGDDLEEGVPTRVEVLPRDPHTDECVGVENVEAAPAIHQHFREARPSDNGVEDEWEMA